MVEMSPSSVDRIWKAFGLKPWLVDTFKLSEDPMWCGRPQPLPTRRRHPAHPVRHQPTTPNQGPQRPVAPPRHLIGTPRRDLRIFNVHFGLLTLKATPKANTCCASRRSPTTPRRCGSAGRWGATEIACRLAAMVQRFCDALDCVDVGFLPDGFLDQLPAPSQIGATRVGGLDLNKARARHVLAALLALAAAPEGFTVADLAARVRKATGQSEDQYSGAPSRLRPAQAARQGPRGQAGPDQRYRVLSTPPVPSPPSSPCAITSSPPSSPGSAAPGPVTSPPTGARSTATTSPCASACRPSSRTSGSATVRPRRHEQPLSMREPQAPRRRTEPTS